MIPSRRSHRSKGTNLQYKVFKASVPVIEGAVGDVDDAVLGRAEEARDVGRNREHGPLLLCSNVVRLPDLPMQYKSQFAIIQDTLLC